MLSPVLASAIVRRNFQQIQMEKLKLDFEFLEATSIHDIDMITLGADRTIQVSVSPNTMLDKIIQMPTKPAHDFSGLFFIVWKK
jgi:hypothetical protein